MDVDIIVSSAMSCGMRRHVIASVDIPSADDWRMSSPMRRVIGVSAPGVGGMVMLHSQVMGTVGILPAGSAVCRQKCFLIGQVTEVEVWPWAALWFPCAMQRKQDGGQSHPLPLCLSLQGQLKWCKVSWWVPPHLLQTTRSLLIQSDSES